MSNAKVVTSRPRRWTLFATALVACAACNVGRDCQSLTPTDNSSADLITLGPVPVRRVARARAVPRRSPWLTLSTEERAHFLFITTTRHSSLRRNPPFLLPSLKCLRSYKILAFIITFLSKHSVHENTHSSVCLSVSLFELTSFSKASRFQTVEPGLFEYLFNDLVLKIKQKLNKVYVFHCII